MHKELNKQQRYYCGIGLDTGNKSVVWRNSMNTVYTELVRLLSDYGNIESVVVRSILAEMILTINLIKLVWLFMPCVFVHNIIHSLNHIVDCHIGSDCFWFLVINIVAVWSMYYLNKQYFWSKDKTWFIWYRLGML